MGAQFRCGHCRRPIGWTNYCPLRDTDTATCVLGKEPDRFDPIKNNKESRDVVINPPSSILPTTAEEVEIDRLNAEIERLRAALKIIAAGDLADSQIAKDALSGYDWGSTTKGG